MGTILLIIGGIIAFFAIISALFGQSDDSTEDKLKIGGLLGGLMVMNLFPAAIVIALGIAIFKACS